MTLRQPGCQGGGGGGGTVRPIRYVDFNSSPAEWNITPSDGIVVCDATDGGFTVIFDPSIFTPGYRDITVSKAIADVSGNQVLITTDGTPATIIAVLNGAGQSSALTPLSPTSVLVD